MEAHFTEAVSIDWIARLSGLGTRTFKRRFKNATGDSPIVYLQRLRVEEAKRYLETSSNSVDEITFKIGYEDCSSFIRLFKKHTGLSPGMYRNKFSKLPFSCSPGAGHANSKSKDNSGRFERLLGNEWI